jgi:hypothetical protein
LIEVVRVVAKKVVSSPARVRSSGKLGVVNPSRSRARRGLVERQYVAVDLHARRSLVVRENDAGEELSVVRIENDPLSLPAALADAGPNPEVAIEATYGWYWAVDALQELGATVRLVNRRGWASPESGGG